MPWLTGYARLEIDLAQYPNLARWLDELNGRSAVKRGFAVPPRSDAPLDARAREALFGKQQYERR